MTRVRTDNVFGTLTDNPLTAGATTMNSAGLANLAVVSSAEAIIIIDPLRSAGAPEIVVVTAHTGSATSATIQRGQFGTTARQHASGVLWVHGPFTSNATSFATAADDQGDYVPMNAWETYAPTLTQSGTVTHTVTQARFVRVGRIIHVDVRLVVTGSGTASNAVTITLPVTAARANAMCGAGLVFDASATANHRATVETRTTTTVHLNPTAVTTADVLGVAGFTAGLASSDVVAFCATYEAAS